MRTTIRLFIFAAIVTVITLTLAPPVRTAGRVETFDIRQEAAAASDALTGTYTGAIAPDVPGDMPDRGTIVVGRSGERWTASAGPDAGTQFEAGTVVRTADGLAFEVALDGGEGRVLRFDLKVEGRRMTGTVALRRDGGQSTGRIDFAKQ
jgi:hypothetical protein